MNKCVCLMLPSPSLSLVLAISLDRTELDGVQASIIADSLSSNTTLLSLR